MAGGRVPQPVLLAANQGVGQGKAGGKSGRGVVPRNKTHSVVRFNVRPVVDGMSPFDDAPSIYDTGAVLYAPHDASRSVLYADKTMRRDVASGQSAYLDLTATQQGLLPVVGTAVPLETLTARNTRDIQELLE